MLHVAVRGYMLCPRFFRVRVRADGRSRQIRDRRVQRHMGQDMAELQGTEVDVDDEPLRRFLFLFQHIMGGLVENIESCPS